MLQKVIALLIAALTAAPAPKPSPTGPVYFGNPAARMELDARPLGFDPDGNARWLVVTKFFDAQGRPTRIMANSDFDWSSHDGYVQWQTRLRYGQPAALLKAVADGPLAMTVRANVPALGTLVVRTDTRTWTEPRVVAKALGPHLVSVGWFPQERGAVRLERIDQRGTRKLIALIAGPSSNYRDTTVSPGRRYEYVVYRSARNPTTTGFTTTPALPARTQLSDISGKGMWLYFTANPLDAIYYKRFDPQEIADRAARAGLHYVELRVAYGAYWEITPEAKPTIDAIVDALAARGIGTIAWTVPRDTSFEDLQATVRAAYYRTANGTPMRGLAIDVERGDLFMGGAPGGLAALWQYMQYVRQAMGPRYLIVPNVEDAYLEHIDNRSYPYEQIARFSDALQPMAYWRMLRRRPTTPAEVKTLLTASYQKLLREARRKLPVSIGGQTAAEGPNGNPPADEIAASLDVSRRIGAIGECFFAWDGTQPYQWDALATYSWTTAPQ